jgi:hypothetical protein
MTQELSVGLWVSPLAERQVSSAAGAARLSELTSDPATVIQTRARL